jgi:broad specificity phosphatase PhoE
LPHLTLIRHAQASFLQSNYDRLSPLGESQSRTLGQYWATHKAFFDRFYIGPCQRHKHTGQLAAETFAALAAPQKLPEPTILPEFDEYDAESVLKSALPHLIATNPEIRALHANFQSAATPPDQHRHFQKLFEAVISQWVEGALPDTHSETWPQFSARVNAGLAKVINAAQKGERIAVITSGGPIAIAVQRALALSSLHTLGVSWMSRNTSWTEFLFDQNRFTLSAFNSHPHLDDASHLTYR